MERIVRADIWTVDPVGFPKPRPAVVVSIDPINDLCPDVLLVPLTTKPGPQKPVESKNRALIESQLREIEEGLRRVLGLS